MLEMIKVRTCSDVFRRTCNNKRRFVEGPLLTEHGFEYVWYTRVGKDLN